MARRPARPASEYRLIVTPHYDAIRQRTVTRVRLETTQTFASFAYEISVDEHREGTLFRYRILGLNAPGVGLPHAGSAHFQRDYEGLNGTYTFSVIGLDRAEHRCTVAIDALGVREVAAPTGTGLTLITDATA
jgi:hypothetical protein